MATQPARVDEDLFQSARDAGVLHSRSAAQQLSHWARLGRELEAAASVTHEAITQVLAGQASYDDLPGPAQSLVREEWARRLAASLEGSDRTERLVAAGKPWAEADDDGNIVTYDPADFAG